MNGTERKRAWRLQNPERSRTAESNRATLRRAHGSFVDADAAIAAGRRPTQFSYPSGGSYQRYEKGIGRLLQRSKYYANVILPARIASKTAQLEAMHEAMVLPDETLKFISDRMLRKHGGF